MYQRVLQGKEKAWGPEHTSTLDTVHSLGALYAHHEKLAEAEEMCARALRGYKKAWGPKHTSILTTVNVMGPVLKKQCYTAAKLSDCKTVLAYIKQLASLCLRFPQSRLALFDCVGRAFV